MVPNAARAREYDYVIVGGGSAGCVLAARLSEDASVQVLLIERGPRYNQAVLGVPLIGLKFAPRYMRTHVTTPQRHCGGRRFPIPVASVMGGGSSINAMIYIRGDPRAYDRWAVPGWGYADILPYFRRMERYEGGDTGFHGDCGPIGVSGTRYISRLGPAFIDACVAQGLRRNDDFTGAAQDGAGYYHFTQSNGMRSSTAVGYLRAAATRGNLHVLPETDVDAIILDGPRAVGVRCRRAGRKFEAYAGREVVVAAGAFGSPRLLLLSGIGPADELHALGIAPHANVPGVGRALQDHLGCPVFFRAKHPVSLGVHALVLPFLRWVLSRDGIFGSTKTAAGAFTRFSEENEVLDCQFSPTWSGRPQARDCIDFGLTLVEVEGRGSVRLASANPADDLVIDPNYLAFPREVEVLVKAIRFARALARSKPLRDFGLLDEVSPGPGLESDSDLGGYVRNAVRTAYHPAGTCAMGNSEASVVDAELRVRGIERLRVADASIMPRLINGNTNGPTIAIAEKAADLIRGRSEPPLFIPRRPH
jgi:choline dehydrogenase